MEDQTVVTLVPKQKKARVITIAVPKTVQIDPDDARNCFVAHFSGEKLFGCPGMGTALDTNELTCVYFQPESIQERVHSPNESAHLNTPDGKRAQWGTKKPIRRCDACIVSEQLFKKGSG